MSGGFGEEAAEPGTRMMSGIVELVVGTTFSGEEEAAEAAGLLQGLVDAVGDGLVPGFALLGRSGRLFS